MVPEIKSKWTAALRSGDYKQAKKVLRTTDDRFCCLGVLCEILRPDKWHQIKGFEKFGWDHDGAESLPTSLIESLAGIDESQAEMLAEMNDSGQSFTEIADFIEAKL